MANPVPSNLHLYTPLPPPPHVFASRAPSFHQLSASPEGSQDQLQIHASADSSDRARQYKSRNKRPCDFCRYKKGACHLVNAPPCENCIKYNKECTFVESPAKRRRPNEQNGDGQKSFDAVSKQYNNEGTDMVSPFGHEAMHSMDMPTEHFPWSGSVHQYHEPTFSMDRGVLNEYPFDHQIYHGSMSFEGAEPASIASINTNGNPAERFGQLRRPLEVASYSPQPQAIALPSPLQTPFDTTSGEKSLDRQNSSNAQIVGISGDSDPYLLAKYQFDAYNEATFQAVRMRRMHTGPASSKRDIPTFFAIQHNALASKAQPQEKPDAHDKWRQELDRIISDDVGQGLIRLYYRYVQPYFPILSGQEGERSLPSIWESRDLSPCVLAAIYGHALPFCAWDERLSAEGPRLPSADVLFKIAWSACQPLLHTPNIAVMQTLLLLVQRRSTNRHVGDTPFKWVMMTTAVSIAQTLGLNRDPSTWSIPSWEVKQRKRLAWGTFVQDKWLALNFGRSSHIQKDDWDVPVLMEDDIPGPSPRADEFGRRDSNNAAVHFMQLCKLSVIVDDILRDLFSVKATRRLHNSLEATLEVAKPLRIRLTAWYQALPLDVLPSRLNTTSATSSPASSRRESYSHELNGNGCLQLSYITAKIELFRAMLRPQVNDGTAAAVTALRTGAFSVAKEITDFLENLQPRALEAFWASYARTNFTIASSFMLLLFVTSPSAADARECLTLLKTWRTLLQVKSRICDLLTLALLRLDDVFAADMERLVELSPAARQAWLEGRQGK